MITIKTEAEIAKMKKAGYIVALVHDEFKKLVKPGITTNELDAVARKIIEDNGAIPSFLDYHGFPATVCASVNDTVVHGIPNDVPLKEGDIVSLDVGAEYEGYHGDSAWTYAVGAITPVNQKLLDATKESLFASLKLVKPGVQLGNISAAIGNYIHERGYSIPEDYTGHGIGRLLHEEPIIRNTGKPNTGPILEAGMTLAIEPMVHAGKKHTKVLKDNWTVKVKDKTNAAHYEHTVLVTERGCQILTSLDQEELING